MMFWTKTNTTSISKFWLSRIRIGYANEAGTPDPLTLMVCESECGEHIYFKIVLFFPGINNTFSDAYTTSNGLTQIRISKVLFLLDFSKVFLSIQLTKCLSCFCILYWVLLYCRVFNKWIALIKFWGKRYRGSCFVLKVDIIKLGFFF